MAQIPIVKFEYVPPDGDPSKPIIIQGMKEYSPGDHSSSVDAYVFELPNGMVPGLPAGCEAETFGEVLRNLVSWFEGETEESVRDRMREVWFNPVHFPHRRSS